MDCLSCELTRARLKAAALVALGLSLDDIASHLSKAYGEVYYTAGGGVLRRSKLPPYAPHVIYKRLLP